MFVSSLPCRQLRNSVKNIAVRVHCHVGYPLDHHVDADVSNELRIWLIIYLASCVGLVESLFEYQFSCFGFVLSRELMTCSVFHINRMISVLI